MAHHQQRAGELQQQLLEQIERLDVKIVGRLVENEQIERPGEEPGQQQPVPLAAGEGPHRRPGAIGREEEILEVAEDVAAIRSDVDVVGSTGDAVEYGSIGIELFPELIEVGDLEVGAVADFPVGRAQFAQQQPEKRRLP